MCCDMQMITCSRHSGKAGSGSDTYNVFKCKNCSAGVSYCSIAACEGRDPITVLRIWNWWVQDRNTVGHTRSQRPPITRSLEDRQVIRIIVKDHAATSQNEFFCNIKTVSKNRSTSFAAACTVRDCLRLFLRLCNREKHRQWCIQPRTLAYKWRGIIIFRWIQVILTESWRSHMCLVSS